MTGARRDILAWGKRDAAQPPPLLKYRSSNFFITMTVCLAIFTVGSQLNPFPIIESQRALKKFPPLGHISLRRRKLITPVNHLVLS